MIGNIVLSTGKDGSVRIRKIQGNDLKVKCEDGDVNISSLYGGDVLVHTGLGNVTVGDAHGEVLNYHHHYRTFTMLDGVFKCLI